MPGVKVVVLFPPPTDPQVFEQRYHAEHIPLVTTKIPGLTEFTVTQVLAGAMGPAPFHWIAELYFDSMDDLQAAFANPGFAEVSANATEISTGGPIQGLICTQETQIAL